MLTGELPFPIETSSDVDDLTAARSILTAHDTGTVKPLEEALKEETTPVHLALQEPVSSALAKEPSQRPTALDFNTQLSEAFERGKRTKIRRKTYNSSRPKKKR
jgi:serine/threonine protein kinase